MTSSKRMNVILDLDATIISSLDPGKIIKGLSFHIMTEKIKGKEVPIFYVYERPYLQDFLDYLFENFNVGVWTAATKDYGSFIVEKIILQGKPRKLAFYLFDHHCDHAEQLYGADNLKDLRYIWDTFPNFNPQNTILLDDNDEVYKNQLCNVYPIIPFEADQPGAQLDQELLKLKQKLSSVFPSRCPIGPVLDSVVLTSAIDRIEEGEEIEE